MRNYLTILLICFGIVNAIAQNKICGKVIESKSKQVVPFVNIGIPNLGVGTVADENGEFCINISDSLRQEILVFSSLGYSKQSIAISSFLNAENAIITLQPNAIQLADIIIKPKSQKRLGNKIDSKAVTAGFNSNTLGCEVGVLYYPKKKTVRIKDFNFHVAATKYDSVLYRVNVYELQADGFPGSNILQENVIGAITKAGWVTVDLRPYNLVTNKNFVISLEWIKNPGNGDAGLYFSAGFLTGNPFFARKASQDKWEKISMVSLGFYTNVEY